MDAPRKRRGDAALAGLPENRLAEIEAHARAHTLDETAAWLAADGIKTSRTALSNWLNQRTWSATFRVCQEDALAFMQMVKQRKPELSEPDLEAFGNDYFQMQAVRLNQPALFLEFRKARHKAATDDRKLSLEERRVTLLEKKAEQADAAKALVEDTSLTEAERAARMREVFGIA
jgi:hypothetical protein